MVIEVQRPVRKERDHFRRLSGCLPGWAERFARLAARYGVANLSAYVEFGFTEDDFWPTKLVRYKTHPLDYFEGKLEQIKTKYQQRLAEKKAEVNAKERNYEQQQQQQYRPGTKPTGKQVVDNRAAAAEAKRRLRERLGA